MSACGACGSQGKLSNAGKTAAPPVEPGNICEKKRRLSANCSARRLFSVTKNAGRRSSWVTYADTSAFATSFNPESPASPPPARSSATTPSIEAWRSKPSNRSLTAGSIIPRFFFFLLLDRPLHPVAHPVAHSFRSEVFLPSATLFFSSPALPSVFFSAGCPRFGLLPGSWVCLFMSCHPGRSGPTSSSAPHSGTSGRAVEGSWQPLNHQSPEHSPVFTLSLFYSYTTSRFLPRLSNLPQNLRRRIPLHHLDAHNFSSRRFHFRASHNLIPRPILALYQHVRQQRRDHPLRRRFIKDQHRIHAFQAAQNFRALLRRDHRPPWPLQRAHARVAVDTHNQHIAQRARRFQAFDMPRMQQIETPVRKHHALGVAFLLPKPQNDFFKCQDRWMQRLTMLAQPRGCSSLRKLSVYHALPRPRSRRRSSS